MRGWDVREMEFLPRGVSATNNAVPVTDGAGFIGANFIPDWLAQPNAGRRQLR